MTDKPTQEDTPPQGEFRTRSGDRRAPGKLAPPPYQTSAGLVHVDRRSPFDRRAEWLREYSLPADDQG